MSTGEHLIVSGTQFQFPRDRMHLRIRPIRAGQSEFKDLGAGGNLDGKAGRFRLRTGR